MTHDHIRNALIIMFILSLATLVQNIRTGHRLEQIVEQKAAEDAMWDQRWGRMSHFIEAKEAEAKEWKSNWAAVTEVFGSGKLQCTKGDN